MDNENEPPAENSELDSVDTKENEIKVDDDVNGIDTKDANIGEPDTYDEIQEDFQVPGRTESKESGIAEHEKEPEPEEPAADDIKTSSKMSIEMDTQKMITVEQSAPQLAVKSETKYEKSKDKFTGVAKSALGSIIDIRHLGESGLACDRKIIRYANSYKMESSNPFNPGKVDKILQKIIEEALDSLTYDVDKCSRQAKWASTAIRSKVKKLNFDRYKIICLVTIGEKHSQDVLATCRFLWDAEKDGYATVSLENTYVFGYAQCFGLYYE